MAVFGDSILTFELYNYIIHNTRSKVITKDYLQTQRNLVCANENLSDFYDVNYASHITPKMILQGNQIMTLKMKATFIEALIYFFYVTDKSQMEKLIKSIIEHKKK